LIKASQFLHKQPNAKIAPPSSASFYSGTPLESLKNYFIKYAKKMRAANGGGCHDFCQAAKSKNRASLLFLKFHYRSISKKHLQLSFLFACCI